MRANQKRLLLADVGEKIDERRSRRRIAGECENLRSVVFYVLAGVLEARHALKCRSIRVRLR